MHSDLSLMVVSIAFAVLGFLAGYVIGHYAGIRDGFVQMLEEMDKLGLGEK